MKAFMTCLILTFITSVQAKDCSIYKYFPSIEKTFISKNKVQVKRKCLDFINQQIGEHAALSLLCQNQCEIKKVNFVKKRATKYKATAKLVFKPY
jgi:hypothetical protein